MNSGWNVSKKKTEHGVLSSWSIVFNGRGREEIDLIEVIEIIEIIG